MLFDTAALGAGWLLRPAADALAPPAAAGAVECSSAAIERDTAMADEDPACAPGWAAAMTVGSSCLESECEGAEIFQASGGRWVHVGYFYAVCSEVLAEATGMPASAAAQLAMMSCEEPAGVSWCAGSRT